LTVRELTRLIRLSGIGLSAVQESVFNQSGGEADILKINAKSEEPNRFLEVCGFANARKALDSIRTGNCDAAYVKILSCHSGCKTRVMCR